jgi:hypothetical protein
MNRALRFLPFERLCRNVILRRSRRISSSYHLENARCFATAQHDISALWRLRHSLWRGKIKMGVTIGSKKEISLQSAEYRRSDNL